MKKLAILAILLATSACDSTSPTSEQRTADDTAAPSESAFTEGEPDQALTEQSLAETGEEAIGLVGVEDAAAGDQTEEQKVAEARAAVTKIIPAGKYKVTGDHNFDLVINADGSTVEEGVAGQMRAVDGKACFEADGLNCFTVTKKTDGAYDLVDGARTFTLTSTT